MRIIVCPGLGAESHVLVCALVTCRDGTLKNQQKYIDGNDTTTLHTIPTSCAILPPLTQIYFVCLFVCCVQGFVEGSAVGSAVSACGVDYVVGGCNVQCTCYTEHGRYGLSCLYAETVESMSSAGSVWYVWYVWYMVCI